MTRADRLREGFTMTPQDAKATLSAAHSGMLDVEIAGHALDMAGALAEMDEALASLHLRLGEMRDYAEANRQRIIDVCAFLERADALFTLGKTDDALALIKALATLTAAARTVDPLPEIVEYPGLVTMWPGAFNPEQLTGTLQ